MKSKAQMIYELLQEKASEVTDSETQWLAFLDSAAWTYKYSFHDQLLIYAQKPNATACASYDDWNDKLHRWIKRGSKGIALLNETSTGDLSLHYVFDIKDTDSIGHKGLKLWSADGIQTELSDKLKNKYATEATSLNDILIVMAKNTVDVIHTNNVGISDHLKDSILEQMFPSKVVDMFYELIKDSISYTAMKRCGIYDKDFIETASFSDIQFFDTLEAIGALGSLFQQANEIMLRELSQHVRSILIEKRQNHILAKTKENVHNVDNNDERSNNNERNQLQERGRLSLSQFDDRGAEESREIRTAEKSVSQRTQERGTLRSDSKRRIEQLPTGSGSGSTSNEGITYGTDDETGTGRNSRQNDRSDRMGRVHEQPEKKSRGDHLAGNDLRLAQGGNDNEQSLSSPPFHYEETISQEEIDFVLQAGSGIENGKSRICMQMLKGESLKNNAGMLREEYGITGMSYPKGIRMETDESGLKISKGDIMASGASITLTWNEVAKGIQRLLKEGRYFRQDEIEKHNEYLKSLHKKESNQYIDPQYVYEIGDTLNIGNEEYEIIDIGDTEITARNKEFPLFTERYTKEDFLEKIKENPLNSTFLKVVVKEQESSKQVTEKQPLSDISIETKDQSKSNYVITDDNLGEATQKARYTNNINAIKLLKELEDSGRVANRQEQEILAKYVGWGGLSEAFDNTKEAWTKEYKELKELLSESEYENARATVLTAFYTPPYVIKAIYQAIENMGFKNGNILEPSCGIGNFMGCIPEAFKGSKVYGIEIDSISGRIAKQLYPNNQIYITGFEKASLSDSLFDVAVGNVPFGNFGVADDRYNKYNFVIHEYFFAKTLDKVRSGGIIAFVTSSFMMDKQNNKIRKYISERAELLGAIRLPNSTFKEIGGTKVTSDILFLKKRERPIISKDEWIYTETNNEGIKINAYYINHPEMVLGHLKLSKEFYGKENVIVEPFEDIPLKESLQKAVANIKGSFEEIDLESIAVEEKASIPADPNVKNFSYTMIGGDIYYRENSLMFKADILKTTQSRIEGMISLRDCVRKLLSLQVEDYPADRIQEEQKRLNNLYDNFTEKYGLISNRENAKAFDDDDAYYLLCSLEILNDDGTLSRKSDIFTKRTINKKERVERVGNANEALMVSLNEYGWINLNYMSTLTGLTKDQLIADLKGVIYKIPNALNSNQEDTYVLADEYLSGNIREKLRIAELSEEIDPTYHDNVEALKKAMPKPLKANEIGVRIGADWIPVSIYQQFIFEILKTPYYRQHYIKVAYSQVTGRWNISSKSSDYGNVQATSVYGTKRKNAYELIEDCLNLKDTEVKDKVMDEDGKEKYEKNTKETILAQQKQDMIKEAFKEWLWKDYKRRTTLEELYNQKFNSVRPREYHGDHLTFPGMTPEVVLKKHQKDAVAHILYGENTLLAHVVGAGKTYEMIAACMELKRLKMCNKPMIVVPKNLVEQWASEFLKLYPAANILVTREKDFKKANRKRFCSRIATGEYDAIIMGHSTFEKIPMSIERQTDMLNQQINEIEEGIRQMKEENAERYTIKQMERNKAQLVKNIEKLNSRERKDGVITFEELGVDRLFVDESHVYKNLFTYTKMSNIGGISTAPAQRSSDMFLKIRYLDEITGGKGTVFATGTPISNSMVELYSIQRYLQYDTLSKQGLIHFDSWATVFGETTNQMELSPEGNYRYKKRFSKFYNLPELMNIFKEVADIKVAKDLNLPVPTAEYINVSAEASDIQQDVLQSLVKRAEKVRGGNVDPREDNMLKITNDGRKLALDQRLFDRKFPDFLESKVNQCVSNVYQIWEEQKDKRLTQVIFSDLSTPANKEFNLYDDIKTKLLDKGVPDEEIAFVHDYNTDKKKKQLFKKVREGTIRVLLGSTSTLGTGSNIQTLLYAIHDLDIPWTPLAFEQRLGRIVRQGNMNENVQIYRYVTKGTFDAYIYQLVENKQRYISQIMTNKVPVRSFEDVDTEVISFGALKALASGNPLIMEKMELEEQIQRLKLAKSDFLSQKYQLEDDVMRKYPNQIEKQKNLLAKAIQDNASILPKEEFSMVINGKVYTEKKQAGSALLLCQKEKKTLDKQKIGEYRGFELSLEYDLLTKEIMMIMERNREYVAYMGEDEIGNITRLDHLVEGIDSIIQGESDRLKNLEQQLKDAQEEITKPFPKEQELNVKMKRLSKIDKELGIKDHQEQAEKKKAIELER